MREQGSNEGVRVALGLLHYRQVLRANPGFGLHCHLSLLGASVDKAFDFVPSSLWILEGGFLRKAALLGYTGVMPLPPCQLGTNGAGPVRGGGVNVKTERVPWYGTDHRVSLCRILFCCRVSLLVSLPGEFPFPAVVQQARSHPPPASSLTAEVAAGPAPPGECAFIAEVFRGLEITF